MKKLSVILILVLLCTFTGCSLTYNYDMASSNSPTDLFVSNNVTMEIGGIGFEDDEPYISGVIRNKSDQYTITYGQQFYIYDGEKEVKPKGTASWNAIAYIVKSGEEKSQTFYLKDYDLEENKTYRLVKKYTIKGYADTHSVYFDFKIDMSEPKGKIFSDGVDVWTHSVTGSLSFAEYVPTFLLSDDNVLYSNTANESPNIVKKWYEVCKLEEFELSKDYFKALSNGEWHLNGDSIDKIIANNKTALRFTEDDNGNFIYILKQNDDSVYYVKGWSGANGLYRIVKMNNAISEPSTVTKVCLTTIPSKTALYPTTKKDFEGTIGIDKYLKGNCWTEVIEGENWVKFNPSRPSSKYLTVQFANDTYMYIMLYFSEKDDIAYASFCVAEGDVKDYTYFDEDDYTKVILFDEFKNFIIDNIIN